MIHFINKRGYIAKKIWNFGLMRFSIDIGHYIFPGLFTNQMANWTDWEIDSVETSIHHDFDPSCVTSDEFKHFPLVKCETFFLKLFVGKADTISKWMD